MRSISTTAAAALGLACVVALAPALAQDNETLTDKAKIEQIVHDYLLAHPEVILESVEKYQAQQEKDAAKKQSQALVERRDELINAPDAPVLGNPKGDVTVVEFFDYRCPYCKSVAGTFIDLFEKDGNVRFVLKEFPILGPESEYAAKAALAAEKQGKYRPLHVALMAFKGKLTNPDVLRLATDAGLDMPRLQKDMESPDIAATLKRNYDLAEALGVKGTPAFVVGKDFIPGAISVEEMRNRIAAARKS